MKRKMLLLALAIPAILAQKVEAQSRLTAKSHWVNNGIIFTPVDSSAYNYSGGRGGDLTHTLKYDNATKWNYIDSSAGYGTDSNYIQTFDINNNITSYTTQYADASTLVLASRILYTYNNSNQVTTKTVQHWDGAEFVADNRDSFSYNAAGKLYLDQYGTWDALTSTFDAVSQKTYIYDAGNTHVTNETDLNVAGTPTYTTKYDYVYTSAGKIQQVTQSAWNGAEWVAVNMTMNTYDGSNNLVNTLFATWDATTGTFNNNTLHVYSYDGVDSLPATDILQTWDSAGTGTWTNVIQYVNTYNSYQQLTSSTGTSYNALGIFEHASGDPMAKYYYSTYDPSVQAVKNVANAGGDANIYPVPAQNMLHVDLNWTNAQTATIAIYNAQGSVVRQWDAPAATQYSSAVSLTNLAEGAYFIRITGAQQSQIVKQFVIAH